MPTMAILYVGLNAKFLEVEGNLNCEMQNEIFLIPHLFSSTRVRMKLCI